MQYIDTIFLQVMESTYKATLDQQTLNMHLTLYKWTAIQILRYIQQEYNAYTCICNKYNIRNSLLKNMKEY